MPQPHLPPSEFLKLLGKIDPDAATAAAYSTGWVAAADFAYFLAVVSAGTLGTSATLAAKIEQATSAAGAGAKDIAGKAITTLTQASPDGSDKQAMIEVRPEELDIANDFTHLRLTITVGTATSDCDAELWGLWPRYSTVADAVTVAEIVA